MQWAMRITSLALEMVVPTVFGIWADKTWGTGPWLVLAGAGLGLMSAGMHFRQLMRDLAAGDRPPRRPS